MIPVGSATNKRELVSEMDVKYLAMNAGTIPQATLAPKVAAETDSHFRAVASLP